VQKNDTFTAYTYTGAFFAARGKKPGYPLQSFWRTVRRTKKYFRFYPLRG
jgi:hypothetical protein